MNIITALSNLKVTAEGCSSDFAAGYLMAINHAIELAEVIEVRRQQEGK